MFLFFLLLISTISIGSVTYGNPVSIAERIDNDDKELVLAFLLNRHGERMPDEDELSFSNEQEMFRPYVKLYGLEGLTNIGKQRSYQLGKFIRHRYGDGGMKLISKIYAPEDIAIRTTDKDRTKMTALVAMAAAYPPLPEQQWDGGLGSVWQPIPYSSVALNKDYLRYYSNCPRYFELMAKAKEDSMNEEFAPLKGLIRKVENETGRNFTEDPLLFESVVDLVKSSISLGVKVPEWSKPIMPELEEAATLAYMIYFRNEEMKKIGGGVLLDDFVKLATDISEGKQITQRLRLYSAHDFNIGALMFATGVLKEPSIPQYCSAFALELYKSKKSGEYGVMAVYLNQAGNSYPETYRFAGCETSEYCELDKFKNLTQSYLLTENEFYQLCNIKAG